MENAKPAGNRSHDCILRVVRYQWTNYLRDESCVAMFAPRYVSCGVCEKCMRIKQERQPDSTHGGMYGVFRLFEASRVRHNTHSAVFGHPDHLLSDAPPVRHWFATLRRPAKVLRGSRIPMANGSKAEGQERQRHRKLDGVAGDSECEGSGGLLTPSLAPFDSTW